MVKKSSKKENKKNSKSNIKPAESITGFPPRKPSSSCSITALGNLAGGGKRSAR